jgi:hypothetical protein
LVGYANHRVIGDLINRHEDCATFNTTIPAAFADAFVICDKAYCYIVTFSAAGTGHDSDMRDLVVSRHPHSGLGSKGMTN